MNTAPGHSLGRNAMAILAGRASIPLLNAVILVAIARLDGPALLGSYSLLVTAFMVLDQGRLLGLPTLAIREVAQEGDGADRFHQGLYAVGLATAVAASAALAGYGQFSVIGLVPAAVVGAAFWPSSSVWANEALFIGQRRAVKATRVMVVEAIIRLMGSACVLVVAGSSLIGLALVFLAGRCVAAWLGNRMSRDLVTGNAIALRWQTARAMVAKAPAFAGIGVVPLLLLRLDLVLLGVVATEEVLGYYGAASRLVAVLLLLPDSVLAAAFAHMSHTHHQGGATYWRQVGRNAGLVAAGTVPIALVVSLAADVLVPLVFGESFLPAARFLILLVWQVPLFGITRCVGDALIVRGHQSLVAFVLLGCLVIGAPVVAGLTWLAGPTGTAAGALVVSMLMLGGSLAAALTRVGPPVSTASRTLRERPMTS